MKPRSTSATAISSSRSTFSSFFPTFLSDFSLARDTSKFKSSATRTATSFSSASANARSSAATRSSSRNLPAFPLFLSFHSSVLSNRRRTVASLLLGARSHAAEPLRGRSDRRVPLRRRHAPLLLHGGQHAAASRASRHAVRQPANRSRRTPAARFLAGIHRFLDRSRRISSRDRGFSVFHEAGSTIRRPHLQTWTPDRAFRYGMPRLQRRSRQVGSTFPRFWIVTFCREMGFRGYLTRFRTPTPKSRTIFRRPPRQPPSTRFS